MGLIGRVREKEIADRILTSSEAPVCMVLGDHGVGKTALLSDTGQRHRASVMTVNRSERMWPYAGLSAVANALSGARGAAIDRILEGVDTWSDFRIADEVSRSLHTEDVGPQVLLIDDIDEMDAASALALSYVFGRLQGTGIRVLATATRIDTRKPFSSVPHTRLEPLSHADAVEFAAATLGPATARGVLDIVAAFTGGNPFAISRVRLTAHEQAGESPVQLPLHLTEEVPRRSEPERTLSDHGPETLRVLGLLALAPETARSALLDLVPSDVSRIDDLIDAGVVESHHDMLRLTDPLLRIALHARMDARERLRGHAESARAHRGLYRHLERWHSSFGEPVLEHESALFATAIKHARAGDAVAAVEFAERALAAPRGTSARNAALVALSDVLCGSGCFALAELYLHRVTSFEREGLRLAGAILSLRIADALDHVVDDAIADGYLESYSDTDPAGCARVLGEVARIRIRRGEHAHARSRLIAAQELSSAAPGTEHQLMTLVTGAADGVPLRVSLTAPPADPDELVELSAGELAQMLRYLTLTEQYDSCRRKAAVHVERMVKPEPYWCELIRLLLLENEIRSGDPIGTQEALVSWERAALRENAHDAARHLAVTAASSMLPDVDPGELGAMIAVGRQLCMSEHNVALTPFYAVLDGRRALAIGRYEDAVEFFKEALANRRRDDDPAVLRCAPDLVEALCLVGRHAEATVVMTGLERAAERHPSRWAVFAVARARAVCASADERSEAFATALARIAVHDSLDERLKLVAARQRIGGGSAGMRAVSPTARTPRTARLTPEELEVAKLVNRGLRNREIAAALYVSIRTVELRLTHIYRKLGVRSRSHLVSVLVRE